MPRRKRIKRWLASLKERMVVLVILQIFSWLVELLSKFVDIFDFVLLTKMGKLVTWVGRQLVKCWRWLLNNVKRPWLIIISLFLIFVLTLSNSRIRDNISYFVGEVVDIISMIIPWFKIFFGSNINFIGLAIIFILVGSIIGFVGTVILESAIILSLLVLLVYGIQSLIQGYCSSGKGVEENFNNEGVNQFTDKTFYGEFCSNMNSLFSGIGSFLDSDFLKDKPEIIFTFVVVVFIPMYTYILRRKRAFVIVRNENFFGFKNDKVSFFFSILNNSKRIRIINRVFLIVNNKVTFLIKDYKKDMMPLMPHKATSISMESKIFKREDKCYFVKGKEKPFSAYLCFEMPDGYWGAKLQLTSPINTILLSKSKHNFKDEILTPTPKVKVFQTLTWNEKKSR